MGTEQLANTIGFLAAGLGIFMFIPQAVRITKTKKTKSISLLTFLAIAFASVLWLSYGLILSAPPVILVNSAILVVSLYIILLKLKYG